MNAGRERENNPSKTLLSSNNHQNMPCYRTPSPTPTAPKPPLATISSSYTPTPTPTTHGGFWAMPRAVFGQIWGFSGQNIVMPGEASAARVENYLPMPMSQGHLNLLASFSAGPTRGGGGGADDENC